jgi:hypothetical protein
MKKKIKISFKTPNVLVVYMISKEKKQVMLKMDKKIKRTSPL